MRPEVAAWIVQSTGLYTKPWRRWRMSALKFSDAGRVGKGVWYALVDVVMWEDHVGRSLARFHEECIGKQAAVVAARKLLAQHAGDFAENITVEAEVLTDLEWQDRLKGLEAAD